jgi:hypothetical protein
MYKGGGSVANGSTAEGSIAFALLPIEAVTTMMVSKIINDTTNNIEGTSILYYFIVNNIKI